MKSKITFRLYQIDKDLPADVIDGYLSLETTDDIDPRIYRLVWESLENPDLDALYGKYSKDDRPNKYVCRSISVSDIVEIEDDQGITFYICDNFGWTEIEFEKSVVVPEMGFQAKTWYVNTDGERKKDLCMEMSAKAAIQVIHQRLGKSKKTVSSMFIESKTYERLHEEKTGLWELSPYLIVDEFEKELKENVE